MGDVDGGEVGALDQAAEAVAGQGLDGVEQLESDGGGDGQPR